MGVKGREGKGKEKGERRLYTYSGATAPGSSMKPSWGYIVEIVYLVTRTLISRPVSDGEDALLLSRKVVRNCHLLVKTCQASYKTRAKLRN